MKLNLKYAARLILVLPIILSGCGGSSSGGHNDNSPHIQVTSDSSSNQLLIPDQDHRLLGQTIGNSTPSQITLTFSAKNIGPGKHIDIKANPSNQGPEYIDMGQGACELDSSNSCSLTLRAKSTDIDGDQETIDYKATGEDTDKTYKVTPASNSFIMTTQPGPGPKKSFTITINDGAQPAGATTLPHVNSICGNAQDFDFTQWNQSKDFTFQADPTQTSCNLNIKQSGYIVTPSTFTLNTPMIKLQYKSYIVNVKGIIYFHNTFPYAPNQKTIDTVKLDSPIINTTIMTNILAGVLYKHLINEQYPNLQSDNYLYGTMFGQLLQEGGLEDGVINKTFNPSDPNQMIHSPKEVKILTGAGQGGPYQINDYAKRLPSNSMQGALGIINYDAVAKSLGYSISDQDTLTQNTKTGPDALDNIYIGPIITAFYHFNDINRMQVEAAQQWYTFHTKWQTCYKTMQTAEGKELTNIVMNVVYNAGDYSEVLGAYLDICDDSTKNSDIIKNHINDYNADWQSYQQALNVSNPTAGDATYFRYPRQVNFYLDQLFNDNTSLKTNSAGILSNNSVDFNLDTLGAAFSMAMQKLSYNVGTPDKRDLQLITAEQAQQAYKDALASSHLQASMTLHLSDDASGANDRDKIYKLLDDALSNVEATTGHKMNEITAHGPPPPLPNPKDIMNYDTNTCKNTFKGGQYVKAQIKPGAECEVFRCVQGGWCTNSCDSAYSLPINSQFSKAGYAYTKAWLDLNKTVSCSG